MRWRLADGFKGFGTRQFALSSTIRQVHEERRNTLCEEDSVLVEHSRRVAEVRTQREATLADVGVVKASAETLRCAHSRALSSLLPLKCFTVRTDLG